MRARRRTLGTILFVLLAATCTTQGAASQSAETPQPTSPSPVLSREERWTKDIGYLVEQMRSIHPDLFHGVPEGTFDRAVHDLVAALPDLDDDEILVGVMHLVAMISAHGRDGHMGVWPPDNADAVHRFPVSVWEFPDGLYVTAARRPNDALVGSRIVSVDGVPIRQVLRRIDPVVPRDNASNLRDARTVFLTSAEVLDGIGIAEDPLTMQLQLETPDGGRRTATIDAVDAGTFSTWVGGWELLLPPAPAPAVPSRRHRCVLAPVPACVENALRAVQRGARAQRPSGARDRASHARTTGRSAGARPPQQRRR